MSKTRQLTDQETAILDRLRARAKDSSISLGKLAVAVGKSEELGRQWAAGNAFPTQRTVLKIAEQLDVSVNWLLTGDTAPADRPLTELEREILAAARELPVEMQKLFLTTGKGWAASLPKKK